MSNSDAKRLLRKGKLSGREAALLIIRHEWERWVGGQGFLSDTDIEIIRSKVKPEQRDTYNSYLELHGNAQYAVIDAGRIGQDIATASYKITPEIASYWSERRLREARSRLPHVVTTKEHEERRLAQREYKLLEPVSLGHVLNWYMAQDELASEQLLQEAAAFEERERPEEDETYYEGLLAYVLEERKEPKLARPWLEWLLEMLRGGRLKPVHYTEEASERAHGYLPSNSDYASIYQEQSRRPGAIDTAALIEAIEQYLAGELEPAELDTRLWDTFITGPELYEVGLAKYQEYIDNYTPVAPDWPILAILQNADELEARFLIDKGTGHYNRESEDMILGSVSLYDAFRRGYADKQGLEDYLKATKEQIIKGARALLAFERAIRAIERRLQIELLDTEGPERIGITLGYEAIGRLNALISMARADSALLAPEPQLPIDEIDISSLEPDEYAINLIESRMGKLLPKDWAERQTEAKAEDELEEEAHEPA